MPANQHSFNSLANETTPATGDAKALAEELTALMRQQTEALERATYLKCPTQNPRHTMSAESA